jgi:Zn-dependent M28 family amino/carboxypeptidase
MLRIEAGGFGLLSRTRGKSATKVTSQGIRTPRWPALFRLPKPFRLLRRRDTFALYGDDQPKHEPQKGELSVNHRMKRVAAVATTAIVCTGLALIGTPATAAIPVDTASLTDAITEAGLQTQLDALQAIADANDGNRAAGTPGYAASVDYVEATLLDAGYTTTRQEFTYIRQEYVGSALERVSPDPESFVLTDNFFPMTGSVNGDVIAAVTAVDINLDGDRASDSGCDTADFDGFVAGNIALIQRGTCDFAVKAANAEAAGASAVIIFNQGNDFPNPERFDTVFGTLGETVVTIPVVGAESTLGAEAAGIPGVVMHVSVAVQDVPVVTENLIADSPGGRTDRTVLAGAHLDSVPEGPGINDNGTGTAALLEIALQMSDLGLDTRNHVRFAFWGGEEDGLMGSDYYVSQLSKAQAKQIAVNLNFDMLGSVNPVSFIYDGDGDAFGTAGPNGSDIIEGVFEDYFAAQELPFEATEFDGRSDYFAFINAGIPAGGLFSGAEGTKTAEQAALFGGTAGAAYDPCYHQACDTVENVDIAGFEQMADAAAHATLVFAETTSAVNGTSKGQAKGHVSWEFKGNHALR